MKPPQERKTPKKIDRINDGGWPNIKMYGTDISLTVEEILEGHNDTVTFRGAEQVRTLRDFAQAWLDYHDQQEADDD